MEDQRFAHVKTDPKFRRIPKGAQKVKIDKRFQSMFKDKKFKVKYTIDKRGRPVNHTSTEDLKRYYQLSSEESSSDEEQNEPGKYVKPPVNTDLDVKLKTDKVIPDEVKKKLKNLKVDYARGESTLFSESSSDDESEEEASESETIEHNWGELDNDAEKTEEATDRLAACNMDWDRIRAVDLMVLFSSFLPPGGAIKSVTIYPSEFGKIRMKEEEVEGPIELVESKLENDEEENEEGSKYHMEKLRQYQLNRLKYYYAVVVCDSPATANKIYTECDGMEYESSATKIDLRFIPDEMTFDDEPKEMCDKLPEVNKYQPRFFTTTALQQAKVDLTWDETDPERIELTQKLSSGKIEDISENDLQNYVAASDDEESDENSEDNHFEEEDQKNPLDKYKQLLQEIESKEEEKKKREIEMEVSWGIDLKNKTEKLVKKKMNEDEEKTPFQKYLDKRKEKRKEKKKKKEEDNESDDVPSDIDMDDPYFAEEFNNPEFKQTKNKKKKEEKETVEENPELELLLLNEDDNKSHFSLKKIQKQEETATKRKRKNKDMENGKPDEFEINVEDERFSALFTSHLYNIDPTSSHYKKTKGMETLIKEKIKRRKDVGENEDKRNDKKDAELSVLVKSVKRKSEALKNKKK